MGEEKNVLLKIVQDNSNQDDEFSIDLGLIGTYLKRFLALWLSLAVALGALSGACALFIRKSVLNGEAKALIWLNPLSSYDVSKIKSPNVIEAAMNETGIETSALETIRNALDIEGVIPDDAYEAISMYYEALSKDAANANAMQSLLNADYDVSTYIVSFRPDKAGMTQKEGLNFLNVLLRAYQDYGALNYNDNVALQNPLNGIDYRDYDYAEAANIFQNTLDNISAYLSQLSGNYMAEDYRSVGTGFTFSDLSQFASSLKAIDLDHVSSYIVIHSVSSNPANVQVSYYEWLIENISRQRAVQRTRLASLTDSIDAYEKDSLVILTGAEGGVSVAPGMDNINANYDAMIREKLSVQAQISSFNRSISYFQSVIDGFRAKEGNSDPKDIAMVKEYLENLNEKLNELIRNVSETTNEYYEKVAFSHQAFVMLPAVFHGVPSSIAVKIVAAVEALLFFTYFCSACFLGLREANPRKERKEGAERQETASATS